MPVPASLANKLELFRARGILNCGNEDLFAAPSWYALLEGMHIRPQKYHPLVDLLDAERLAQSLRQGENAIADMVKRLPSHAEFISRLSAVNK